jgi:hypothetical protein
MSVNFPLATFFFFSLQVTVVCVDAAGTKCSEIEPPPGQCAVGTEINTVRF